MSAVYELTFSLCLTLIVVIVAIYVFAARLQASYMKQVANERIELDRIRRSKVEEIKGSLNALTSGQLQTMDISELNTDLKQLDRRLEKLSNKSDPLSLRKVVIEPSMLVLFSLILIIVAIIVQSPTDDKYISTIFWIISLLFILWAIWHIYKILTAVEYASRESPESKEKHAYVAYEKTFEAKVGRAGYVREEIKIDKMKGMKEDVETILSELRDTESLIVKWLYGIGTSKLSESEIADKLGIEKNKVEQIRSVVLGKCLHPSRSRKLKQYINDIPVLAKDRNGEQQFILDVMDYGTDYYIQST